MIIYFIFTFLMCFFTTHTCGNKFFLETSCPAPSESHYCSYKWHMLWYPMHIREISRQYVEKEKSSTVEKLEKKESAKVEEPSSPEKEINKEQKR